MELVLNDVYLPEHASLVRPYFHEQSLDFRNGLKGHLLFFYGIEEGNHGNMTDARESAGLLLPLPSETEEE